MRLSRKMMIACGILLAISIPLAALGTAPDGGDEEVEQGPNWIPLASEADPKSDAEDPEGEARPICRCCRAQCPEAGLTQLDLEKLADKLELDEDEVAELEGLLAEIEGLRDEMKSKVERVHEILGPKIRERTEEKAEECRLILEDELCPLMEELKELHEKLRSAESEEEISVIKAEIEELHEAIRSVKEKMAEMECWWTFTWPLDLSSGEPRIGPGAGKRLECFKENVCAWGERIRTQIRKRVKEGPCDLENISDEESAELAELRAQLTELQKTLREVVIEGNREKAAELRAQMTDLMNQIRELCMNNVPRTRCWG